MDLELLHYPPHLIPRDVDGHLWLRYLRGSRAFDNLWGEGKRCPNNPQGTRCACLPGVTGGQYCEVWKRLEELADAIGGTARAMVQGMG